MVLLYVENNRLGEVVDIANALRQEYGNVDYRNPRLFEKPNRCQSVYIHGYFPKIEKAYGNKVIQIGVSFKGKSSTDYTIADLREMRSDFHDDQWKDFTKDDTRKSIDSI